MTLNSTNNNRLDFIIASYGGHPVFHNVEFNEIHAGTPLTIDAVKLLVSSINKEELDITPLNFESVIPNNVVRFTTEFREIIFTTPPQRKKLLFSDKLTIKSAYYPIPALVWKVVDSSLSIFAIKEDHESLQDNTALFQAPFLNVSSNGDVCMGSAEIKDAESYEDFISKVKYAFFESIFTHTNCNTLINGSITDMYAEQLASKTKTFDNSLLIDTKTILNDIF